LFNETLFTETLCFMKLCLLKLCLLKLCLLKLYLLILCLLSFIFRVGMLKLALPQKCPKNPTDFLLHTHKTALYRYRIYRYANGILEIFFVKSNLIGFRRIPGSANQINKRYRKEIVYNLTMWGCCNGQERQSCSLSKCNMRLLFDSIPRI
jgi:hypothetical protein